ncbi:hypothetical protein [Azospirillum soli]|uniref:hypothetical protein n=1 Tax=Azospirillum soli TaxID=1304799 RepID=UPI001AE8D41E|nr:hypothetical protein [Azospirillum soli]MBP2311880.1 hypothetical protein [Azospirillum soli]
MIDDLLAKALEHGGGTHTVDDVWEAIEAGRMQLWRGQRSVMVTEVVQYPRLKAVRVFAAAGDMAEVLEMEEVAAAWGKQMGCQRIEGFGRPGWRRVMKGRGYEARTFGWRVL